MIKMIKDECERLYHLTKNEENTKKVEILLAYTKYNNTHITTFYHNMYLISPISGIYICDGFVYLCNIIIGDNPLEYPYTKNKIQITNQEEIEFDSLLLLLCANNLLTNDSDIVKKEVDQKFNTFIENRKKESSVYYELTFSENEIFRFYLEFQDFCLSFRIDTKDSLIRELMMSGIPEDTFKDITTRKTEEIMKQKILELGINFMKNHNVQELENGVVVDNVYYESLEVAIYTIEKEKR